jgi:hypothetical protein
MSPSRKALIDHPTAVLVSFELVRHACGRLTWYVEGAREGEKEQGREGDEAESHVGVHVCCGMEERG